LAKNGSFGFTHCIIVFLKVFVNASHLPKGWLVGGEKPNVPLAGGLKLFLKNAGGKKIKNTGSAMSVGLLVVRLKYRFYVFGHLSKWFEC
jgi:hypothetical protein